MAYSSSVGKPHGAYVGRLQLLGWYAKVGVRACV